MTPQTQELVPISNHPTKSAIWPMVKRTPAYLRLGLELAKNPSISHRHKLLLYSTVAYQVSPLHLVVTPIPVVGQLDCIALLLLSIRQMATHCPPAVFTRCLQRSKIEPSQYESDMNTVIGTTSNAGRQFSSKARFAGRVVRFMGLRAFARLVIATEKPNGSRAQVHLA
jgi:uncharacterized membrane protein YkvA (DUF1232 family)